MYFQNTVIKPGTFVEWTLYQYEGSFLPSECRVEINVTPSKRCLKLSMFNGFDKTDISKLQSKWECNVQRVLQATAIDISFNFDTPNWTKSAPYTKNITVSFGFNVTSGSYDWSSFSDESGTQLTMKSSNCIVQPKGPIQVTVGADKTVYDTNDSDFGPSADGFLAKYLNI